MQYQLWKKEVQITPKSERAWLNYYEAKRGIMHKSGVDPFGSEGPVMDIVNEMEKAIPHTFTFNFCKGNQLAKEKGYAKYMIKAYEINPTNPKNYANLIVYYEMQGNRSKRKEINQRLFDSGTYSTGLLNLSYNVLTTVEKGGVLITTGDNDTYPLWILQDVFNVRKDVNIHMMRDEDYIKVMSDKLGAEVNTQDINSMKDRDGFSPEQVRKLTVNLVQFLVDKTGLPIYFGQTVNIR
jgi:hypothetical protein